MTRTKNESGKPKEWELRIYVAGETDKSRAAIKNLQKVCEEHLQGRYHIEVVDLMRQPQLAAEEQIFAVPTVVRKLPEPLKKLIGDLSATEKVLVGLDIKPKNDRRRPGKSIWPIIPIREDDDDLRTARR